MKNLTFLPLLLIAFAFVSCSKDEGPSPGQETVAFDIPFNVYVAANATTDTPSDPPTKLLASVLSSSNQDKASHVKSSAIFRNQSYISITGLADGATLNNIAFSTSDKAINFSLPLKTVSRDTTFYDDAYTNLLKQVSDYMASKKSIALKVTYTAGDRNIGAGVIKLHVSSAFSW